MSAIGLTPKAKIFISSHADYRREDFVFARTQSYAMRALSWEKRAKPLQSWDRFVYSSLGFTALALAALTLLLH